MDRSAKIPWDYTIFGTANSELHAAAPQQTIEMVFEKIPGGAGKFNLWLVNGKPYPHEREFVLQQGTRYRLVMRNRTDDAHPDAPSPAPVGVDRDQRQKDGGRD